MAKFFNSPSDLLNWVKSQNHTAAEAADKLASVIGSNDHQQDIAESARRIFAGAHADHAAEVIFNILARYDVTEAVVKAACEKIGTIYAANELLKNKMITADQHKTMVKEAQMAREPGMFPVELRVCPKLPMSVASRRVSTYVCLHYCNASMTLDDEPQRVYCMEALWRKHVADKFSRDLRDPKTGHLVGGYINNRFFVFPDAGTPANPDVPRDGGNPLALKPGERTRQPRQHEWSIERRMQEQREKGSTKSNTVGFAKSAAGFHEALLKQASVTGFVKIAESDIANPSNTEVASVFSEAIDLHTAGVTPETASVKLATSHNMKVEDVVRIQEFAIRKLAQHQADVYTMKVAQYEPVNSVSETSTLEQQQSGGTFTAGEDIPMGGNNFIPAGTVLTRDVKNPTTFYLPDAKPVTLSQDQIETSIVNSLDTEMLGLTKPTNNPAATPTPAPNAQQDMASVPAQGEPAATPTADPNAPPVY